MAWGVVTGGLMYLAADLVAFGADGGLEGLAGGDDVLVDAGLVGGFEALPVFAGELGVDGQEGLAVSGRGSERRTRRRSWRAVFDFGVADELAGGEHLLEEHAELDFGEAAAGFDVGEDAGEVVDAFGEPGHLAEAGVDLGELIGDLAEGLGEAGVEGGVELFVDGDAHLFELGGVVAVEFGRGALRRRCGACPDGWCCWP